MNQFPQMAMNNRNLIEQSTNAGCFCCVKMFDISEIKEYTDHGKTVICPLCGVDSVVGNMCGFEVNESVLQKAHNFWFKKRN